MKCNQKNATKEMIWRTANEFALYNLKIVLITLHEDFGMGKDRLSKFVKKIQEKVKRYDEADNDGILDYAINRDVRGLELDAELTELLTSAVGSRSANRKVKKSQAVSMAELEEVRCKMLAFQDLQKEGIGNEFN